jgi:hypothetical protein
MLHTHRLVAGVLFVAGCSTTWLAAPFAAATVQRPPASVFAVVVAGGASAVRCQYMAFLSGVAGSLYDGVHTSPTATLIVIDTSFEGRTFEKMKAFIYCPGFGMTLLDVPSLSSVPQRTATISPAPLGWIHVTGNVTFPPDERRPENLEIELTHWADWIVEYYGTWDGAVPQFTGIATARLSSDNTFTVDLPNLARDPLVSRFKGRGTFTFMAQSKGAWYRLEPKIDPSTLPPWPAGPLSRGWPCPAGDQSQVAIAFDAIPHR